MALLTLDDVHKSYGETALLRGVSLVIEADTRIGIVGANGCGKSTLLRLLAGTETPDEGRRTVDSGLRIGHLPQEVPVHSGRVRDAVREGLEGRDAVLSRITKLHAALADPAVTPTQTERALADLARQEIELDRLGGADVEHRVEELITRVGLPDPDADAATLSGGEQRRVALARLLLGKPDLLLLDEPTNHLDAFVIEWLEELLVEMRTPLAMVTHDRYFLDRVIHRVVEVEHGALFVYDGGYAGYLHGKAAREIADQRAETSRQSQLRRESDWMSRGPPARSTKAKARIGRYHALVDAAPDEASDELAFRIPPGPRLGTRVIRMRGVTLRFGDRTLLESLDLDIGNDTRLGIVGPNGSGKTTLIRAITGDRPPDAGSVELGETVRLAAIDQRRSDLNPTDTVVQSIAGDGENVRVGTRAVRIESFLDRFLFPGGRKHTRVGDLSGGERNRVLLARLLIQGGNVLVLDEPTNDLDLPTLRALEEALVAFEGAVVIVSHDRWFLDRVATDILYLDGTGRAQRFGGDLSALLDRLGEERRAEEAAAAAATRRARETSKPTERPKRTTQRLSNWETTELDALPAAIDAAEVAIATLNERIADPTLYTGPAEAREAVQSELTSTGAELERLYARWEELEERRDG